MEEGKKKKKKSSIPQTTLLFFFIAKYLHPIIPFLPPLQKDWSYIVYFTFLHLFNPLLTVHKAFKTKQFRQLLLIHLCNWLSFTNSLLSKQKTDPLFQTDTHTLYYRKEIWKSHLLYKAHFFCLWNQQLAISSPLRRLPLEVISVIIFHKFWKCLSYSDNFGQKNDQKWSESR